jgi:acetolactate synthase-1/2/3 large subunit
MAAPNRQAIALIGDGGFCAANPSVIATAMEANLNIIWVVMDNSAFGTIAGLEDMHYGTTFGCVFERDGKPYNVDYAAIARGFGANGVMVTAAGELGPALRAALTADRPTLIQVPMENAPTPTPGHWDINDIYRRGE